MIRLTLSIWIMLTASIATSQEWSWPGYPDEGALGRYLQTKGYTFDELEDMTFDQWRQIHNQIRNENNGKYVVKHSPGWNPGRKCGNGGCAMCYGHTTKVAAWDKSLRQVAAWDSALVPTSTDPQAPTPVSAIDSVFNQLKIGINDYVVDLGCGDGRVVVAAAKRDARAVGVEIDATKADEARKAVSQYAHASILTMDVLELDDLSKANVVYMYLYVDLMEKLKPTLATLKPGAQVVTYLHRIPGVRADKQMSVTLGGKKHVFYLYIAGKDKFR